MQITIQPYHDAHRSQLIELILPIQQIEFNVPITLADQPDLQDAGSFFENYPTGKGRFWVALADEKVVGSIGLLNIGNGQACLRKMFVHHDFRGKTHNLAQNLLEECEKWAITQGLHEIFLGTREDLYAARRFYERNDFILVEKADLPQNFPLMTVDSHFYKK